VVTESGGVKYLGSHPRYSGQAEGLDLEFTEAGLRFSKGRRELGFIGWEHVRDLAADSRDGMEQRITATRVVLLGALALLAKKQRVLSYLIVTDSAGDWMFEVPGLSAIELDAGLRSLQPYVRAAESELPVEPETPVVAELPSVQDRLQRLGTLLETGLITAEEYAQRRTAILDSL
jgi:hypothetical protein